MLYFNPKFLADRDTTPDKLAVCNKKLISYLCYIGLTIDLDLDNNNSAL